MSGPLVPMRMVVLIVSTLAAPFAAEGLFSLLPTVTTAFQTHLKGYDRRTKREVITSLRASGVDAFPSVQPAGLLEERPDQSLRSPITLAGVEVLPLGGISDKQTVFCNETGQYMIYQSDEHGFHNPKRIWSLSSLDIAAVGDSLTHGGCVPSEKNAVALIRNRYSATLNLGMSHNGPLFVLASIREYLPAFKPRAVIWFHSERSDLADLALDKRSPLLLRYLRDDTSQGLRAQQDAVDRSLIAYVLDRLNQPTRRERAAALGLERGIPAVPRREPSLGRVLRLTELRQALSAIARDDSSGRAADVPSSEDWVLFSQILRKASDTVASWNGRLYFVYLPSYSRYQPVTFEQQRDAHRRVLAIVRELGIPAIEDPVESFAAHENPKSLFARPHRDAHYTEEGYRIIAQSVLEAFATGGRIKPSL